MDNYICECGNCSLPIEDDEFDELNSIRGNNINDWATKKIVLSDHLPISPRWVVTGRTEHLCLIALENK